MLELKLGLDPSAPLTALCLGAHCDDIEIGCGGTLLQLASRHRLDVHWVMFSSNATRADEARRSAEIFLASAVSSSVTIHEHRDGFLPSEAAAVKDRFERLKGELRPDLVFTHTRDDLHQDHRLVCELTWNTFRDHLILEYEIPKWDGDLGRPNVFVALGEEEVERKIDGLLAAYASQANKGWFTADLFRSLLRLRGMECNAPSGHAEAFTARKLLL